MKKTILSALAAAVLLFSASAHAIDVTATVSGESNYVDRGISESGKGFSASTDIKATIGYGLFGEYIGHTGISLGDGTTLKHELIVGVERKFGPVAVQTGVNQRLYTGNAQGKLQPSDHNFNEVFVKASAYGFNAELDKGLHGVKHEEKNTYVRFGYTTPAFHGLVADVGTAYTRYVDSNVTRHTNTEAKVSYQVLKNVSAFAAYSFGGKNELGRTVANQATFGATASF